MSRGYHMVTIDDDGSLADANPPPAVALAAIDEATSRTAAATRCASPR
jgi:hypothetical protein